MDVDANERAARARKGSPYLTPKEAAHFLKRSYKTIKNWRALGYGPKRSRSGFHIDDLEAWQKAEREKRNVRRGFRRDQEPAHS